MKKIISIIMILAIALPTIAIADVDVKSMTDQELKDLISACSHELMSRNNSEPDGILLFDNEGIRLYQIGDAYLYRGRIRVPCMMFNDREDYNASVSPVFAACNGYAVYGSAGSGIPPQSKVKCELDFATDDIELTSLNDVYSLIFGWQIYSLTKPGVIYGPTEREEHRFW